MNRIKLFLWVIILCSSCSTSKMLTSDVKPVEVTEMLKIEPFSYISLIETGNKSIYNASISSQANTVLNESLERLTRQLRLPSKGIKVNDSFERKKLENEINYLVLSAERNRNIKNIGITPMIDSLLRVNNMRFGLIIIQSGFTRAKGNYGGQVAKGVGLGILTMGMYVQTPVKSSSAIYAMIVDNKNKNVAFYNKSVLQDEEPTEEETITQQLYNIFEKYFFKKK